MNQAIHSLRLFFCFFSGEDDFIIRKCNTRIQLSFAFIGFFVIIVFIGCWVSSGLFMSHIFDGMRWISIPVGVVWALLVTVLYLLLLYTLSPGLLPVAKRTTVIQKGRKRRVVVLQSKKRTNPFLSVSFLGRIGLIIFIAVIIAQPINVWLFTQNYEAGDRFSEALKTIFTTNPVSWIITVSVCGIMLLPVYFKYSIRTSSQKSFQKDFESEGTAKGLRHLREQLGNPTDFKNLAGQILGIDINSVRTSDFYFQKSLIEHRIILEEYEQLKKDYASLLMEKNMEYNRHCWENLMPYLNKLQETDPGKYHVIYTQLEEDLQVHEGDFQKYEYWADHPFRTMHQAATRRPATETELLQTVYPKSK